MKMVKIKCSKCGAEGSLSLIDPTYNGPFKCWKCRALYLIKLENDQLISCEPLSQEEFDKLVPKKRISYD